MKYIKLFYCEGASTSESDDVYFLKEKMGNKSRDKTLRKIIILRAKELECFYVFGRVMRRDRDRDSKGERQIHFNLYLNHF